MKKIVYDRQARQQIEEIFHYGKAHFGPNTALRYKAAIRQNISILKSNPFAVSIEHELSDDTHEYRYLLVKPYKIIYSVKDDFVRIHFFWHTSRNPDDLKEQME